MQLAEGIAVEFTGSGTSFGSDIAGLSLARRDPSARHLRNAADRHHDSDGRRARFSDEFCKSEDAGRKRHTTKQIPEEPLGPISRAKDSRRTRWPGWPTGQRTTGICAERLADDLRLQQRGINSACQRCNSSTHCIRISEACRAWSRPRMGCRPLPQTERRVLISHEKERIGLDSQPPAPCPDHEVKQRCRIPPRKQYGKPSHNGCQKG